jgi:hypothetical protein
MSAGIVLWVVKETGVHAYLAGCCGWGYGCPSKR